MQIEAVGGSSQAVWSYFQIMITLALCEQTGAQTEGDSAGGQEARAKQPSGFMLC